jgi:hypothetical protein
MLKLTNPPAPLSPGPHWVGFVRVKAIRQHDAADGLRPAMLHWIRKAMGLAAG